MGGSLFSAGPFVMFGLLWSFTCLLLHLLQALRVALKKEKKKESQ